ncbi:unnamed protein product [Adineta ricciae]|uniref:Uncharacterized protein n=1 Tax=Adineta ricciae TaxID=249248 RepID=A0A814XQ84_ADIRI|nr:unnamed protein product [Adineta ricciae]CAF1271215.1 unnamed protein product [Adineta ricciae]
MFLSWMFIFWPSTMYPSELDGSRYILRPSQPTPNEPCITRKPPFSFPCHHYCANSALAPEKKLPYTKLFKSICDFDVRPPITIKL